jgi:hypothetical protein
VVREKHIFRQLLADGRGAAQSPAAENSIENSAHIGELVDAVMLAKIAVFRGDDGMLKVWADIFTGSLGLAAKPVDQRAVVGIDFCGLGINELAQVIGNVRQITNQKEEPDKA